MPYPSESDNAVLILISYLLILILKATDIVSWCLDAGAHSCGIVRAEPVSDADWALFTAWRDAGRHATMAYMERNDEVRRDPRLLIEGPVAPDGTRTGLANTLIVCIFAYDSTPSDTTALIADYACREDYHRSLRRALAPVCTRITDVYGGQTRICVDSAPLRERYWAVRAGLGHTGRNGQLTVPGLGAHFLIATIAWTGTVCLAGPTATAAAANPTANPTACSGFPSQQSGQQTACSGFPSQQSGQHTACSGFPSQQSGQQGAAAALCGTCRRCVEACPQHALDGTGSVDARRCLSFLTIESRNPLPEGTRLAGQLFGCDICRKVCPHSHPANTVADTNPNTTAATNPNTTADTHPNTTADTHPNKTADTHHNTTADTHHNTVAAISPLFPRRADIAALTPADICALPTNQLKKLLADTPLTRTPIPRLRTLASLLGTNKALE